MLKVEQLLREGRAADVWQMGCGYLDLSLDEFMRLQRRMLLEQLELLRNCELGRRVMRGAEPQDVEAFRRQVPLTTYQDYAPYLLERREDVLPEPPVTWQRTSGRSGEYPSKWVPVTERVYEQMGYALVAMLLLTTCSRKGEVAFTKGDRFLYGFAPRPYTSGVWGQRLDDDGLRGLLRFFPKMEEVEQLSFEGTMRTGFDMALSEGLDIFYGLASVLMAVGNQFSNRAEGVDVMRLLRRPKMLLRMARALLRSRIAGRSVLPKDIWSLKGVACAGVDAAVYRDRIKEMWGKDPLQIYSTTETILVALQAWDHGAMTFLPHFNFFEFISEEERSRALQVSGYEPQTILLDQVRPGQRYELVVTNLLGGPFVRYRVGDVIEITALRNEELDIDLPQMVFFARAADVIDIAGFTRLTEKSIWQAVENAGVANQGWTASLEEGERSRLHLYLETGGDACADPGPITAAIHEELKRVDSDYADLEGMLGLTPLHVTLLSPGTFQRYRTRQQRAGVDQVRQRPPHLNPPAEALELLLACAAPEAMQEMEADPEAVGADRQR